MKTKAKALSPSTAAAKAAAALEKATALAQGIALRGAGKKKPALKLLAALQGQHPDDPQVNYQVAWTLDSLGREREAVPYYERALTLGLAGDDLRGALVGLGSTYRCLGDYKKAVMTFKAGQAFFPDAKEFDVFLAMALYNQSKHQAAMMLLLNTIVELADASDQAGLVTYKRAISFYADKLDKTWP